MDDPAFMQRHGRVDADGLTHVELSIRGLHCASCVWRVEALPQTMEGLLEARVNFRRGRVQLTFDASKLPLSRIAQKLDAFGYTVGPVSAAADTARMTADHAAMIRMAVAGACAGNAMLLAFALYAGLFDGMSPLYREGFRWGSLVVTCIALLWPGMVFFRSAWAGVRSRSINLDAPIALALLAGGVWSVISTIIGKGEVYFDSVSVLIFALLVGRFIQQRQQRWAADSVELLYSLTPQTARRVVSDARGESIVTVAAVSLSVGDVVEVLAGESFPADGTIRTGHTSVDTSLLTGESLPRSCSPGDAVFAGSVNVASTVRCVISASGLETRVAKLMALVEESTSRKAPIVQFGDRVGSSFLAGMILLSLATFAIWARSGVHLAIENAVSLLVVTCPCALGLATPLAFTLAIGRAARRGILIKGGDAVQNLAEARGRLYLDKTGTLTTGRMSVVHWHGDDSLATIVAALERGSTHPAGAALAAMRPDIPRSIEERIVSITNVPGAGLEAQVGFSNYAIGSEALASRRCERIPTYLQQTARSWASEGLTPIYVVVDGRVEGLAGVGDAIREESASVVRALRDLGWDCRILSGDDPAVVSHIGKLCGIESAQGGMTPEQKLAAVTASAAERKTVMVGDGVNDAAALAAAHVGISIHGGAEASLAAADVYLAKPGLSSMLELASGCRRTMSVIKFTLGASSLYNIAAAGIAMSGHMHPIIAALIMPLSSLTAVSICVGAGYFRSKS
jgi:Cu2+-exporting ATPase